MKKIVQYFKFQLASLSLKQKPSSSHSPFLPYLISQYSYYFTNTIMPIILILLPLKLLSFRNQSMELQLIFTKCFHHNCCNLHHWIDYSFQQLFFSRPSQVKSVLKPEKLELILTETSLYGFNSLEFFLYFMPLFDGFMFFIPITLTLLLLFDLNMEIS